MPAGYPKMNAEPVYYILSGSSALFDSVMFVVLTVFYYSVVGLNPLQLVLVGTVLEGSILLFEVPTGVLADTYSRRLSVIVGTFVLGFSFMLTSLAHSFPLVLVAQAISGLGYTFLSGATEAWLADEVGENQVGRIYFRAGQVRNITSIVGIAISGILASVRVDLPVFVGGALYMLQGMFLAFAMPETGFRRLPVQHGEPAGLPAMLATFREGTRVIRGRPILLMLVVVSFFWGAASEGYDRLGDAHLVANFRFPSLGSLKPVVWFSILGLAGALLSLLTIEIFRRKMAQVSQDQAAAARWLLVLNTLSALCVIGFSLAGSFPAAVAYLMVRGMLNSLLYPLYETWLVQSTASRVRATIISLSGQSNALGQVLGGPGVGWIGTVFSLRAALFVAGILLAPISGLYARAIRGAGKGQPAAVGFPSEEN